MTTLNTTLLAEITQRLVEELHPEQIILFGSHAWGTPTEDSDIDLMVIVPDDRATARPDVSARRALRGLGVPKDILVRTRSEIERARQVHASLESEVIERGVLLYG